MKVFVHRFLFFILSFFLVNQDASSQVNRSENVSSEILLQKLIDHPVDSILNGTSNEKLAFVNAFMTSLGYVLPDKARLNELSVQLQFFIKKEKNRQLKVLAKYLHFNVLAAAGLSAEERVPILAAIQVDAKDAKDDLMSMQLNMDLGLLYIYHLKEYEKGFLVFRQNLELLKDSNLKQHPLHLLTVSYLTQLFLLVKDWNNAMDYARKGLQLENTAFDKNSKLFLLQSIGKIYQTWNMLDSSDYYFQKMLISAKEVSDSSSMYNAYGYIGENYIEQKEYARALPLIEMQKKYAIQINDLSLIAIDLLLEAEINFQLGNLDKCKALINESEKYVYASNMDNTSKSFYALTAKISIAGGDRKKGLLYLDSLFYISEKIDTRINAVKGLKAEQLFSLQLAEKKAAKEDDLKQKNKQRNIFLLVILFFLFLSVFFIYDSNQKKINLKLLSEKKLVESELASAQKELSDYIIQIDAQVIETLHWDDVRINTTDQINRFMDLFSKLHPGFIQKVKDTLSGVTPGELRFLCLSKIRITDNQMSIILGVNPNTIRQTRKRLKDKFSFETNESMLDFIDKL